MQVKEIKGIAIDALEDSKALDIQCIDVKGLSSVTDYMIIATGTSKRHVRSVAENLAVNVKKRGLAPLGSEGEAEAEWILVDLGDVLVNVMMPDTRARYNLEKLWSPILGEEKKEDTSQ